ncbi:MAG TPA: helix-turn-helix domain-containing protein [Candidatus Limnocylindrales bacterium]|nr:helix-turn-helix domain-containing protein [Candidatus Limnocylindrales bacterium]
MARSTARDPDWISLSEASRVLGVSAATIRRWSDAGRLRVFMTPGGHRRFSRASLERLLPADRMRRPSLGSAGLTPARITRSYRRAGRSVSMDIPWVLVLTDEQRRLFRERGRLLAGRLIQHLDAPDDEGAAHHLAEAAADAAEYGRLAASLDLSLSQTVEGFLRFRAPFHHELAVAARRRGFDARETTDLLESAERAMDRLLVATMTGHSVASVRRPRASR